MGHSGDPGAPRLTSRSAARSTCTRPTVTEKTDPDAGVPNYPVLDLGLLRRLPKARKTQDMHRIYTSRNSEDWVTWKVTRLWERAGSAAWWRALLGKARQQNPELELE